MAHRIHLMTKVRRVLSERFFTDSQIDKIIPNLHKEYLKEPKYLIEIVDTWNTLMGRASTHNNDSLVSDSFIPPLAHPPRDSSLASEGINMATILAEIEPKLLLFDPKKLLERHKKVASLSIAKNLGELWVLLYYAPRGFYLQDWLDLTKKVYYIEHYLIDFLYDKKEQKDMIVHPLVRSAAATEAAFDHIRTRYLFASRCGYTSLSHLYDVQTVLDRPFLRDLVLSDDKTFLSKFAPYCTHEEYKTFSSLIKSHDYDEDDADVFKKLAELDSIRH